MVDRGAGQGKYGKLLKLGILCSKNPPCAIFDESKKPGHAVSAVQDRGGQARFGRQCPRMSTQGCLPNTWQPMAFLEKFAKFLPK